MLGVIIGLAVFVIVMAFGLRIWNRLEKIDNVTATHLNRTAGVLSDQKQEWYDLSWSGENPFRVVTLASIMTRGMSKYEASKHMASSFYSQVKHLIKKGHFATAIAFMKKSRIWTDISLSARTVIPVTDLNPIDLEVLGAPDFMLSRIPVFGTLCGFKARAIDFLDEADGELASPPKDPLMASIIWSKLWSLTGNPTYRERVRRAGLNSSMSDNQLGRIAKHMGFRNTEELLKFCGAKLAVVM